MITTAARAELDAIQASDPERLLKPVAVVETATDPANALHPYFEWNDDVAGHQYRVNQARALIRTVYILPPPETSQPQLVYVSLLPDRSKPGGGYRTVAEVLVDDILREEMLQTCLMGLRAWMWRYRQFQELVQSVAQAAHLDVPEQPPSPREEAQTRRRRRRR